jgi:hypothetical protein
MFNVTTPLNIKDIIKQASDKSSYKNRLIAVEELGKWKCPQSINMLFKLMKYDKVYIVKNKAFINLQRFGENVKLPKKKKGHLVKDINKKLLVIYNSFQADNYTLIDFKLKFREIYPELYDIYQYEKNKDFDNWIQSVIKHSPMKRLKNVYKTVISFESSSDEIKIYSGYILYKGATSQGDKVEITSKKITIESERRAIINPKDILDNDSNTIQTQIIKALLFYYLFQKKYVKIKSIIITREKSEILQKYKLPNSDTNINQVLDDSFNLDSSINFTITNLLPIFGNDEKSISLFNSASYFLKAKSTNDSSGRFEKLWKAFNSIYRFLGNSLSENECHIYLREFLISNHNTFSLSQAKVSTIDKSVLRQKLRLRDLILNDYETKSHTVAFLSFIYRYSDCRISELLKETLVYREDFLKDIFSIANVESRFNKLTNVTHLYSECKDNPVGVYPKVVEYLDSKITGRVISDIELVSLICIKYAYFIRNKIFHGERHDLSFRIISNKITVEIDWISEILETLIIDLIKNNSNWVRK